MKFDQDDFRLRITGLPATPPDPMVSVVEVEFDGPPEKVIAEMADEVAVMYAGELVEVAPTAELFASPRHPYTAGLIRSGQRLPYGEPFGFIPGNVAEPGHWPGGCRFAPRCPHVMPVCSQRVPPFFAPRGNDSVRCFLYDSFDKASTAGPVADSLEHPVSEIAG